MRKAKVWLTENNIEFDSRHIINENPSYEELKTWHEKSGLDIDLFFSKNGKMYKELGLKDKIKDMSLEEKLQLLATSGKLLKRPLLITADKVLIGFKLPEYEGLIS